ncbi:mitochondrial fission ELM1 [Haloferula helveola]|uniref:Mitochondrial fission ELM1 n=2 Tax=Haloferula helveola TaxID=490095 RepID=A0ABM7RHR0_9BACT|nr:mitochondrial fission ELM1 [Haloferula helveola]
MLTDGKPGHENQSLGLIEAIDKLTPVELRREKVERNAIAGLLRAQLPEVAPALIVGAGHSTHAPMLKLARQSGAPCVVLMKPSLPLSLFDLCLIPEHDIREKECPPNVEATIGAINRVPPPDGSPRRGGLILLGGPSSTHGWDADSIRESVTTIVSSCGDRPWRITDSRRTPDGQLSELAKACPALVCHPHADTGPEWLPQRLTEAAEVWVSEDSVSMIYESLSSGAKVGLFACPQKKTNRITRGVDRLSSEGWVTRFADWDPATGLTEPPRILRESDRCAGLVLGRFFPERLPKT